jgi:cytochrome c
VLLIALVLATVGIMTLAWRTPSTAEAPPEAAALTEAEIKDLFLGNGCISCHDVENTLVGPPFVAIAERYGDRPEAEALLVTSLREGSQGSWGNEAMPLQRVEKIGDAEAAAMVRWILALADSDAPTDSR